MACPADIDLLCTILVDLREFPTVVQLGAGSGTLALGVFGCDFGARLFSIDNRDDGHHYEMQALENAGINIKNNRYFDFILDSTEAAKLWCDGPIDMIIVDAAHDYKSVRADIEA